MSSSSYPAVWEIRFILPFDVAPRPDTTFAELGRDCKVISQQLLAVASASMGAGRELVACDSIKKNSVVIDNGAAAIPVEVSESKAYQQKDNNVVFYAIKDCDTHVLVRLLLLCPCDNDRL